MYPTLSDGIILANAVKCALEDIGHIEVVLCPPSVMLPQIHEIVASHPLEHLKLGVQNIHHLDSGPYTGEISAEMVKAFAKYVIVGHSERIKWFHETPYETSQKVKAVLRHKLTPILCVGEREKSESAQKEVVEKLESLTDDLSSKDLEKIIIGYEPVWAIGTGTPASGEYAQAVARAIREQVGSQTPILYGGSTNAANIAEFLNAPDIDGALVGGASVKSWEFIKMCEIASEIKK